MNDTSENQKNPVNHDLPNRAIAAALDIRGAQLRQLKATAQRLEPILKIGKNGMTDAFVQSLDIALSQHGLVKVRFAGCKDEKKTLTPILAEKTGSALIMRVGNVAVFFRPKPESAPTK